MKNPLVSVVTPTYNHSRYIGRCIESLLAQTHTNWEQVIVDDGSTDNTAEVVASYHDPRITYVLEEHRGVTALAETMNVGVRKTKGDLVTAIMSDDMWPPYRMEKQIPVFEDPNVVLCFGRQVLIDENDKVIGETPVARFITEVINRPIGSVLHELLVCNFIPQPTVLLRRAALEKIGGYLQPPGLLAEDWPTHLALALVGEFRFLDLPLGYYRMGAQQQTRNIRLEMYKTDDVYIRKFYRSLDLATQRLTGWTEGDLDKELLKVLNNGYFAEGRRALLRGDRKYAVRLFATALWRGSSKTKMKAIAGLACAALGTDLEKIGRLFGRPPLR